MLVKLTKVHNTCVRMLIDFNLKSDRYYDKHARRFRSYVTLLDRNKLTILLEDWS